MRLTDAYRTLQWSAYERKARGYPRGVGTSAHMLIELYLDMARSQSAHDGHAEFLVECTSSKQGRELREWLEHIDQVLDQGVDLGRVRFWPTGNNSDRLRGVRWFSWAIFCDHAVKERGHPEADRNMGPYGLVRRLEPRSGQETLWEAYDRDDQFLGLLTEEGKTELIDMAACPITLGGPHPTTYPASTALTPDLMILLRRSFKR